MQLRLSRKTSQNVQTLFHLGSIGTWTDAQLVTKFVVDRDGSEAAFRMLLARHGPMVMGVCRRILDDPHAAEDAFQATFMVLVKKAGTLRNSDGLTNWLYGVALRTARKARAAESRRRVVESRAGLELRRPEKGNSIQEELRSIIDEEVHRLPERYRLPLLLCHMEGLHHEEVAERLGCPVGTVESRLFRARERLRARLIRRGLAPTAGAIVGALLPAEASAALTPLIDTTIKLALGPATMIGRFAPAPVSLLSALMTPATIATSAAGLTVISLLVASSVVALGMDAYRAELKPIVQHFEPPGTTVAPQPKAKASSPATNDVGSSGQDRPRAVGARSPIARARPLSGITIDGQLDDWPTNLEHYPIRNRLTTHDAYDRGNGRLQQGDDAFFMVGFDRNTGRIYLAVVIQDEDLVVRNTNPLVTDAVEIYVDGLGSDRTLADPSSADWAQELSAANMPVIQYVGLPGRGRVYGYPSSDGVALLYGRLEDSNTEMRYRRNGSTITYEWAVQAFDAYPSRPTRLERGKHLGLDIAVVDRDRDRLRPTFTTWGRPPTRFKGFDPRQLGELIIDDGP
jgi:RNA polymerase sigma factor (sigma-70 family)